MRLISETEKQKEVGPWMLHSSSAGTGRMYTGWL